MARHGKKFEAARAKVEPTKKYGIDDGLKLLEETKYSKFDETVDVAIRLGVDPRHSDQMVRGTVSLPNGTGKKIRILVFAKGEKEKEARDAGADFVGSDDLVEKINGGWLEFDKVIATPDMMGAVGKLGKVLGPRGLMPNPKIGTVTFDLAKAIKEFKAGKVEFRAEKAGILHISIGKVSFGAEKLKENLTSVVEMVIRLKPSSAKGIYVRSVAISSTMGPGIRLDPAGVQGLVASK